MSTRNLCKICFKFKNKIMDNFAPLVLQCHTHPQTGYHSVILVQTMDYVNVSILSHAVNVLCYSKFSHESPAVVFSPQTPSFLSSRIQLSHYSNWDTWPIHGVSINSQALEVTFGRHTVWCPKCQNIAANYGLSYLALISIPICCTSHCTFSCDTKGIR